MQAVEAAVMVHKGNRKILANSCHKQHQVQVQKVLLKSSFEKDCKF